MIGEFLQEGIYVYYHNREGSEPGPAGDLAPGLAGAARRRRPMAGVGPAGGPVNLKSQMKSREKVCNSPPVQIGSNDCMLSVRRGGKVGIEAG